MAGSKSDDHARNLWGAAYDSIPKSVFATLAWHLAAQCNGESADDTDATFLKFYDELRVLGHNGIIPKSQVLAAIRSFEKGDRS